MYNLVSKAPMRACKQGTGRVEYTFRREDLWGGDDHLATPFLPPPADRYRHCRVSMRRPLNMPPLYSIFSHVLLRFLRSVF